ncbi:hypothetical protein BX600DRAFT_436669 [Xylariales sp. PMI_506]|nr:hypothetical protein BX600DRAFT_436669 [Xylariales sp. PMI_506]
MCWNDRPGAKYIAEEAASKLKGAFGSFAPMNTLDSSRPPPPAERATSPNAHPPEPPTKKQKLDVERAPTAGSYTAASFELGDIPPSTRTRGNSTSSSHSRSDMTAAGSIHSSSGKANPRRVNEFRQAEKQVNSPRNKRFRPKPSSESSMHNPETLDDSEEEVQLVPAPKRTAQPQISDLDRIRSRFTQPRSQLINAKRKHVSETTLASKHPRNSSPDPLAGDGMSSQVAVNKRNTGPSPSESKRGSLQPTSFKTGRTLKGCLERDQAQRCIPTPGLLVCQAVSGDYRYPEENGLYIPCYLRVHEISTILVPTSDEGDILRDYPWLDVNLKNIRRLDMAPDGRIVSIIRSPDSGARFPGKLIIELGAEADREAFSKWAHMPRTEPLGISSVSRPANTADLAKQLNHMTAKARKSRVTGETTASQPSIGDDIKLIQSKRQVSYEDEILKPGKERIKDSMRTASSFPNAAKPTQADRQLAEPRATRVQTRTLRTIPVKSPEPQPTSYTEENPNWADGWAKSLVFPSQGKNRATVDKDDIPRLDEGQFLNDNLIIFKLRHLQYELEMNRPDLAERIHFHNTFFYERLKPTKSGGDINYDSVKGWTSKVDLFAKDFIVVPINEYHHWYVAIIYNAPKLVPSSYTGSNSAGVPSGSFVDSTVGNNSTSHADAHSLAARSQDATKGYENTLATNATDAPIKTSNSMGTHPPANSVSESKNIKFGLQLMDNDTSMDLDDHTAEVEEVRPASRKKSSRKSVSGVRKHDPKLPKIITLDSLGAPHSPACQYLRYYLIAEMNNKKGIEIGDPGGLGMTAKNIPLQENHCDCGLYLLGYIQEFLKDPDSFIHGLLQHEQPQWEVYPSKLRQDIRDLIFDLQNTQKLRDEAERKEKYEKKKEAARNKRRQDDTTIANNESLGQARSALSPQPLVEDKDAQGNKVVSAIQDPSKATEHVPPASGSDHGAQDTDPGLGGGPLGACVLQPTESVNPGPVTQSRLPGSFPESPSESLPIAPTPAPILQSGKIGSDSTMKDSVKNFLSPLRSPSSRGETPDNPLELDDSMEASSPTLRLQEDQRIQTPRTNIQVEIPASRIRGSGPARGSTPSRKRALQHSRYFPRYISDRQERLISALYVDDSEDGREEVEISD